MAGVVRFYVVAAVESPASTRARKMRREHAHVVAHLFEHGRAQLPFPAHSAARFFRPRHLGNSKNGFFRLRGAGFIIYIA